MINHVYGNTKINILISIYILYVSLLTTTINEFRNNHYGRGGSTHHLHHFVYGGEIGSTGD